jgi:hypothetical protein
VFKIELRRRRGKRKIAICHWSVKTVRDANHFPLLLNNLNSSLGVRSLYLGLIGYQAVAFLDLINLNTNL